MSKFVSPPKANQETINPTHAVAWLALFAGVAAVFGGSSRFDAIQAVALRPLAALFLVPALYWISVEKLRPAFLPLALLGLMALWTLIQLVPLPSDIWHTLADRKAFAELDTMFGLESLWRPISLVPMRGWNAFWALLVPATAILLALALRPSTRTLFLLIVAIGVADALLGLMQIADGRDSILYFYTHTNAGSAVGVFANENHSGVFSAIILLIIARLAFTGSTADRTPLLNISLAGAFLIVSLGLFASSSRAAIGLGALAFMAIGAMMLLWYAHKHPHGPGSKALGKLLSYPKVALLIAVGVAGVSIWWLVQSGSSAGVADTIQQNAFEGLRWSITPVLLEMVEMHWLFGTGFGTFDSAYLVYEPTELQGIAYVNQAHNDWLQLIIEGGLPAIILTLLAVWWVVVSVSRLYAKRPETMTVCLFWCALFTILFVASIFDYPLRTPVFQLVAAWLIIALVLDGQRSGAKDAARRSQASSVKGVG